MLPCKSFLITYVTQHTYFYPNKHKTWTPGTKFSSKEIVEPPTLATPVCGCQRTLMALSAFSLTSKTPTLFGWSVSRTRIRGYCCLWTQEVSFQLTSSNGTKITILWHPKFPMKGGIFERGLLMLFPELNRHYANGFLALETLIRASWFIQL